MAILLAELVVAQRALNSLPEQGSFVLHKFAKAIGKEIYKIAYQGEQALQAGDERSRPCNGPQ